MKHYTIEYREASIIKPLVELYAEQAYKNHRESFLDICSEILDRCRKDVEDNTELVQSLDCRYSYLVYLFNSRYQDIKKYVVDYVYQKYYAK